MPTSIPRTRSVPTMANSSCQLVTGKAEKVPAVVHKLMHVLAADERSGSLLCADEIDRQEKNEPNENRPGNQFPNRYGCYRQGRCEYRACHPNPPGIARPVRAVSITKRVWLSTVTNAGRIQWRDRAGISPAS